MAAVYGRMPFGATRRCTLAERVRLIEVDGEVGLVLPDAVIERFGLEEGDEVFLTSTDDALVFDLGREASSA